jgi:catechol 2,3-dioxygenase
VHLHVGDLKSAAHFYGDAVGFDRMVWSYPSALFLGAGGYHHHLGTNTWAGPTAIAAAPDDPQLVEWVLEVPTAADVTSISASLRAGSYDARDAGDGVATRDPWGTALRIVAAAPG